MFDHVGLGCRVRSSAALSLTFPFKLSASGIIHVTKCNTFSLSLPPSGSGTASPVREFSVRIPAPPSATVREAGELPTLPGPGFLCRAVVVPEMTSLAQHRGGQASVELQKVFVTPAQSLLPPHVCGNGYFPDVITGTIASLSVQLTPGTASAEERPCRTCCI